MTTTLLDPPFDDTRPAVWSLLDWRAEHTPSDPWMIYPSPGYPNEREILTFADCATASHRASYGSRVKRIPSEDGSVVAVLLHTDTIHYTLLLTGLMRAGFVPLPIPLATSPEAICEILRNTDCHRMYTQSTTNVYLLSSAVRGICVKQRYSLRVDDAPTLDFILPQVKDKNARKTLNVGLYSTAGRPFSPDDIALYLPSSTLERYPHPTPMTHRAVAEWQKKVFQECKGMEATWAAMNIPSVEPCGIFMHLLMPLASGAPVVLCTPKSPLQPVIPTPQTTLEMAKTLSCTGIIATAAFVEEWARNDKAIQLLSSMKLVIFTGTHITRFAQAILASSGINFVGLKEGGTILGGLCKSADEGGVDDHTETKHVPKGNPLAQALRQQGGPACIPR